jgi:L-alanine-DL-glutamate epimerase-like enolase superfamily enzyme
MKSHITISHIEIFRLNIPLKYPFVISLGTIHHAANVLVKIHTTQGLYGVGESCPYVYIVGETQDTNVAIAHQIAHTLKGKNALDISGLTQLMNTVAFNPSIKSAFDMALYDLASKAADMPLYAFLGGSNMRLLSTDMTVGIGTPQQMAASAKAFADQGFPAIKAKLGKNPPDDVARIAAIREAIGMDIPLRIDANQGWNASTAVQTLRALAPYQIQYCEEPLPRWNLQGMTWVRQHSPIPIMADESLFNHHDAFQLLQHQACDYFNIKLSKSGGIRNASHIASIAEAAGIQAQVGCMSETRLALSALAHFVLATPAVHHCDMDSALMLAEDPVLGGIEYLEKGQIRVPDAPGIGADIDAAWLRNMERVVV